MKEINYALSLDKNRKYLRLAWHAPLFCGCIYTHAAIRHLYRRFCFRSVTRYRLCRIILLLLLKMIIPPRVMIATVARCSRKHAIAVDADRAAILFRGNG